MQQNIIGIIPARYNSSRFPGKPLVDIAGKSMIETVYNAVKSCKLINKVVIATDDQRIFDAAEAFGAEVMMTSVNHKSGTDRCAEVINKLVEKKEVFDIAINIQGDEPFIKVDQINCLIEGITKNDVQICTLAKKIEKTDQINDSNVVKVVKSNTGKALYFSRYPIPFVRDNTNNFPEYFKHIGIYAFKAAVLQEVSLLKQSPLEISESLEQLRWLENDYSIQIQETQFENQGIDTPEDLKKIQFK